MEREPFSVKRILEHWDGSAPLSAGSYAMHHMHNSDKGTLVRLDKEVHPGMWSVTYVQLHHEGGVMSGGGSSAWSASEFKPIADPILRLAAEAFECDRRANEAERHATLMHHERYVRLAAISAIKATK